MGFYTINQWKIGLLAGETDFHYGCPADFEDFHIHQYESVYDA